ncbi:MAG TPA: DUF3619 family protein [Gallionella sp.]|nr:DUF3619 family protein [Gallionella sp.]
MTHELDPRKIAELLTQGTRQLDAATISALVVARQNALKRQSARAPVFAPASVSPQDLARWTDKLAPHSAQAWIAALLLVAILATGTSFWQSAQEQQIGELDVAILTDDLPIEVFVD